MNSDQEAKLSKANIKEALSSPDIFTDRLLFEKTGTEDGLCWEIEEQEWKSK